MKIDKATTQLEQTYNKPTKNIFEENKATQNKSNTQQDQTTNIAKLQERKK